MADVGSLLSRVAAWLHLTPSEAQDKQRVLAALKKREEELTIHRANNNELIEEEKVIIRRLQARARKLHEEYKTSDPVSQELVVGQIEGTFEDLDRRKPSWAALLQNLSRLTRVISNIAEIRASLAMGITEDEITDLALDKEEAVDAARRADDAMRDLEGIEGPARAAEGPKAAKKRAASLDRAGQAAKPLRPDLLKRLEALDRKAPAEPEAEGE